MRRPKRRLRFMALGIVLVAAIGAIGTMMAPGIWAPLFARLPSEPQTEQAAVAAPHPQDAADGVDRGAARSAVYVLSPREGNGARTVVTLAKPVMSEDLQGAYVGTVPGILVREVTRQALLLAARDELGATTRDEVLGEVRAGAPGDAAAEFCAVVADGKRGRVTMQRPADKIAGTLLDCAVGEVGLPKLVEHVEALSRKEFPAALRKLGVAGKPNTVRADLGLPADAVEGLNHLGYSDLFRAVRALHAANRQEGESPVRLAALARAYALLGVLTQFHWNPAHKAFTARGLLYAERLVARSPDDPIALWNRAFVRGLTGMHVAANNDLRRAEKLCAGAAKDAPTPPEWVALIDAYIHYDTKAMTAQSETHEGLAALMRLLSTEFPWSRSTTVRYAMELLAHDPDCFRAIDAICQAGGLNDLHVATVAGPKALDDLVPRKLRAMDDLPSQVRRAIEDRKGEPALVKALLAAAQPAADQGEPSWGVLAHLITETRFIHVKRRLDFMRNRWNVPFDQYWNEVHLLVADHPYRLYLDSLTLEPAEAQQALVELAEQADLSESEVKETDMHIALRALPNPRAHLISQFGMVHSDLSMHDKAEQIFHTTGPASAKFARQLLSCSPNSPYGRATLVERAWDEAQPKVARWRKSPTGDAPAFLAALGKHYAGEGKTDEARGVLKRYIEQCPEFWAYELLARQEQAQGDRSAWRRTLDEFLERGEDGGLDGAKVRVEIAYNLMQHGHADEAIPYAETAAHTWAGWAMECAGQCYERTGDFERAEFWFRNEAERYARSFFQWFHFCKRTNRGDAEAAAQWAAEFIRRSSAVLSDNEKTLGMFLFDLAEQPAEGLAFLRSQPPRDTRGGPDVQLPGWIDQMFLARFADTVGDHKARDAAWARVAASNHPGAAKAVAQFQAALAVGASGKPFDPKAFDAVVHSTDPVAQSFLGYFAGRFLEKHGRIEDAALYYERFSITFRGANLFALLCAKNALRSCLEGRELNDAHLLIVRATARREANQLDAALEDAHAALKIDPDSPVAINLLAVMKRAAGDYDEALAGFARLIALDPKGMPGLVGRAVTYILMSKDREAEQDLTRALELEPKNAFPHVGLGLLSLARHEDDRARQRFEEAIALDEAVASPMEALKKAVREKRGGKAPE